MSEAQLLTQLAKWVKECLETQGADWPIVDAFIRAKVSELSESERAVYYGQIQLALTDPLETPPPN